MSLQTSWPSPAPGGLARRAAIASSSWPCVTQELAGQRVAQVVIDPEFGQSGVHWSWGKRQQLGRAAFAQPLSAKAQDHTRGSRLWTLSQQFVGLAPASAVA